MTNSYITAFFITFLSLHPQPSELCPLSQMLHWEIGFIVVNQFIHMVRVNKRFAD